MWTLLFLMPLAYAIYASFAPLKPKYQLVPSRGAWLLLLPALFIGAVKMFPMTAPTALMCIVTALLSYYLIRGIMFMGLLASYRAFAAKHPLRISLLSVILAWALTLVEPLVVIALLCSAYLFEFPAPMSVSGMSEVLFDLTLICTGGAALSAVYLFGIHVLRRQVSRPTESSSANSPSRAPDPRRLPVRTAAGAPSSAASTKNFASSSKRIDK